MSYPTLVIPHTWDSNQYDLVSQITFTHLLIANGYYWIYNINRDRNDMGYSIITMPLVQKFITNELSDNNIASLTFLVSPSHFPLQRDNTTVVLSQKVLIH